MTKIPYPPSPENVPDDLTAPPESYRRQQNLLLAGLFVFLAFYLGLVALFGMLAVWCALTLGQYFVLKVVGLVLSGIVFLFLVKGFFKRPQIDKHMHLEITQDEQPVLFAFIHRLCDELDAPLPNKVYVSPDVNAAVMPRSTLVNLFVEPKKDLLIGLGLVNCMNLTEFKSVLAHEFGHFSQSGFTSSYGYVASKIILDLIQGEDWFDRGLDWCKQQSGPVAAFGYGVGGVLYGGRWVMERMFNAITLQRMAVMRESEFHADLVAVKAAGSDAVALSLFRLRFGNICQMQSISDLAAAADHKLYSRDIFLHQERCEEIVRRKRKNPKLGVPPAHDHPTAGQAVRVFDPDNPDPEDDVPEMRRTHPPAHELEANAKATYIPAVVDHRSPWVLFTNAEELKERVSYKLYRMVFKVEKNAELADPEAVQAFIDAEHADTTYDPKYEGIYDERKLYVGDTDLLNQLLQESPWDDERIGNVYAHLYEGCKKRAEEHTDLYKELAELQESNVGRSSPKVERRIREVETKLETVRQWLGSFDRRAYLVHIQMAAAVDPAARQELADRYFFHLEVQRMYLAAQQHFDEAEMYLGAAARFKDLPPAFFIELRSVLRRAWVALRKIVDDARKLNFPAMKNFEEGDRLADFILEGPLVSEPRRRLQDEWVNKFMTQLSRVRSRCFRLHFKSIGGILALQERIAAAWLERKNPPAELPFAEIDDVAKKSGGDWRKNIKPIRGAGQPPLPPPAAEDVIDADVIDADVIDAQVLDAQVLDAQVIEAEVIEAQVLDAQVVEAEVLDAEVFDAEVVDAEVVDAEVFDAEVVAPPPAPPRSTVSRPAPPPPSDVDGFSLDLDEPTVPQAVDDLFSLDLDAAKPTAAKTFAPPAPATEELVLSLPVTTLKPATATRPAVKITIIRPGEKSPFAN